jgi:hypothetical protein
MKYERPWSQLDILSRCPVVTIRMTYGRVALDNAILHVGFRPRRNSDIVVGWKPTCNIVLSIQSAA